MQKKHLKTVQMLIFTIVFTLTVIGAASAADNSSTNLAATNVDQATQQATQTSGNVITNNDLSNSQINNAQTPANESKTSKDISTNVNNADNSATDPQIWNGKAPVSRGGQIPTYNWGTIQNAINHAKSGDTIMLANSGTFSGAGNTRIIISKNLIFNVLKGGRATIDGRGTNWGFIISPGYKVTFNNINFKNMVKIGSGGAIFNRGTLTLNNCVFTNKRAALPLFGVGGAICNFGNLVVNNCRIYDNRGYNHGSCTYTCKCGNHIKVKANVVMTKTSNGPVNVGQTGVYTITLSNNGPDAAKNIKVTDPLPDGFSLGSFSAGNYDGTVWTIPTLDNGATATLTFTRVMTTADIGTTKTNTATQTQDTHNPNPVPPQTATIYTNKAVLSITKTTNQTNYNVGNSVVYNIDVLNNGPDTATNVGVTDTVANGLTYISSTLGGVYNTATRTITWNLPSLASGAHFMPSFTATVNALTQGQTITNIAFTNNSKNPKPVE